MLLYLDPIARIAAIAVSTPHADLHLGGNFDGLIGLCYRTRNSSVSLYVEAAKPKHKHLDDE